MTTSTGSWRYDPTSYSYGWKRCDTTGASCVAIAGATSQAYTVDSVDVGHTLEAVVTAKNRTGSASGATAHSAVVATSATTTTTAPPVASPPANTAAPALSGTATSGQTLSVTNGSWSNNPTSYTYAWRDCNSSGASCASISGVTSNTYRLQSSDIGDTVEAVVTATNASGAASASSPPSAIVAAPASSPGALLLGTQTVASTQDSNPSGIAQAFSFTDTNSGTASSVSVYVGSANGAGTVTAGLYTDSNGSPGTLLASGSIASPKAGAWNSVPIPSTPVSPGNYWIAILGTGSTLAFVDQASGSCDTQISQQQNLSSLPSTWSVGQTWTNAYCPVSAYVSGTVSATNPNGSTNASAPTNTASPTVSGSAVQGQTLSAGVGTWSGAPSSYAYQWQRCSGSNCSNVSGSTDSTYVIGAGDVGDTLRVQVTATNGVGASSAMSAPTTTVAAVAPTSNASCSGTTGTGSVSQLALDACGFPSMDTTGPPFGTIYVSTYPNGLTISQPGTYSDLNVTGEINITASNVTIQDSQVTDADNSNPAIVVANGVSNVQINYTSIHGTSDNGGGALFAAVENLYGGTLNSVTMDHDQFYNGDRILVGYGTVTNSYCLGGATFGSEHDECVYTSGAAPGISLTHDTLLNANPYQTAAVFVDSPTGCAGCTNGSGSITIEDSILGGGGYCIYGGDGGDGSVHTGPETIENNRFSRLYFSTGGQFGTDAYIAPDVVWSGNVWDDTNQTISSP